ncbi:hypothetical protein [Streptomyces sp. SID3212]|uniref:hypothetical protein n=1 Tax=Streptomyces sp. SID3212 TaxID=2690259 RepID=UPI001371D5F3|nr:hypothetical protein [Streptomyces sp. SID3212]MYV51323.1 hypothetical protein [Streptomyces sp. SID3212]
MTADTVGDPGGRRRERQVGRRRSNRFYMVFDDTELEVVRAAAGREGMAPAAWAARQLIAVGQQVLVPVSQDAGDVLRELVQARVQLRETVRAVRALPDPAPAEPVRPAPSAPLPTMPPVSAPAVSVRHAPALPVSRPRPGPAVPDAVPVSAADLAGVPAAGVVDPVVDAVGRVLAEVLAAVSRVDAATVQVMRERRPRS